MTGSASYIELGVEDLAAARRFYGELLGWQTGERGGEVATDTLSIGVHGEDPSRHFEVFFVVDDLDASLAVVRNLGGSPHGEVTDAGPVGRYVECSDDQGVRFALREVPSPPE